MMDRVLIFGGSGQVGSALQRTAPPGVFVVAHDIRETDIRDRGAVGRAFDEAKPTIVMNCAGYTRVDDAESNASEAQEVNGVAPGVMAELSQKSGARFFHLSTDYVFDGRGSSPYTPDSPVAPINVYGATKLDGERRVLAAAPGSVVVRTAWVHSSDGANFVRTAVKLLTTGKPMTVVDDQIGTPTRAAHLAEALWRISARRDLRGLLHFTDAGVASWFDVAVAVLDTLRRAGRVSEAVTVAPAPTDQLSRPARRPLFSVLDKNASWQAIGYVPPHWREGVVASTMELLDA